MPQDHKKHLPKSKERPKSPEISPRDAGVEESEDGGFSVTQFAVGAAVGGLGGFMDSQYIEPFGLIFGGTLAVLQVLDYSDVISLPWNSQSQSRFSNDVLEQVTGFVGCNIGSATGFAAGYLLGYNVLDWSSAEIESDSGEGASSSSSSSE